jgi:hypothetical protein
MKNKTATTDNDILKIARRINAHQERIRELMESIRDSGHPGAEEMFHTLDENLFGHSASAVHCVWDYFNHPELWALAGADIARVTPDASSEKNSGQ